MLLQNVNSPRSNEITESLTELFIGYISESLYQHESVVHRHPVGVYSF